MMNPKTRRFNAVLCLFTLYGIVRFWMDWISEPLGWAWAYLATIRYPVFAAVVLAGLVVVVWNGISRTRKTGV